MTYIQLSQEAEQQRRLAAAHFATDADQRAAWNLKLQVEERGPTGKRVSGQGRFSAFRGGIGSAG